MYGTANPSVTVRPQPAAVAGKKFLVVGGTSGIGQALARLAASSGADVTGIKSLHVISILVSLHIDSCFFSYRLNFPFIHIFFLYSGGTNVS